MPGGLFVFGKGGRAVQIWTMDDYAALAKAMGTGALEVQFGSGDNAHRTKFRSLAEMERMLDRMENYLGINTGSTTSFVQHRRG
jgi:hypothetical protein